MQGVFQVFMTEQDLNRAEIRAGLTKTVGLFYLLLTWCLLLVCYLWELSIAWHASLTALPSSRVELLKISSRS
jgi:hypothetical protein